MIKLKKNTLENILQFRNCTVTLEHILDNSKAGSGGRRDMDFLKYLVDNDYLILTEAILRRKDMDLPEEYYLERYKKYNYETDRHFICRTIIQDELKKHGINTYSGMSLGNMDILRSNANYDIVTEDFTAAIDVGLTPARNYFKGLTDLRIKHFYLTTYFDDYIEDIIFSVFTRDNDEEFLSIIKDYMEGLSIDPALYGRGSADDSIYQKH